MKIRTVALGENHYGVISEDFNVYTWGRNDYGQLGHGTDNEYSEYAKIVNGLSRLGVYYISFGESHSLAMNL